MQKPKFEVAELPLIEKMKTTFSYNKKYWCPVNLFKSFKIKLLSQYKSPTIASLIGSLMRIKLLGRRRQWLLDKGEDCLSERSERVPQPQKSSAADAV